MIDETGYKLNESNDLVGLWFHPNHKDTQVPGILKFDGKRSAILMIEGKLQIDDMSTLNGFADGKKITLLNCSAQVNKQRYSNYNGGSYTQMRVIANNILIGEHYKSESDIELLSAFVLTSELIPWSQMTALSDNSSEVWKNKSEYKVFFKDPSPYIFYESKELTITLRHQYNHISTKPSEKNIGFNEINYFEFENTGSETGLFFSRPVDSLRRFLSFASRHKINIQTIKCYIKENPNPIYFLYPFVPMELNYTYLEYEPHAMFFTLPMINNRVKELYTNWYEFYKECPEPLGLYFNETKEYQFNKFIPIAQALEDYHRKKHGIKNDWSFRKLIIFLFERQSYIMKFTGEAAGFAQKMVDHRDYFTHWFDKKKHKVTKGLELEYLTRDAYLLFELCVLEELGFKSDQIEQLISNNIHLSSYLKIPRKGGPEQGIRNFIWQE